MTAGSPVYSEEQNMLYSRLLNGLKAYSKEELYAMNSNKKKRIVRVHKRAQEVLNLWKQELMLSTLIIPKGEEVSDGLAQLFTKLTAGIKPDPKFFCTLSFKDLGLKKADVIEKFMEEKLLPADFYSR
jgi:hypothetical protein